MKISLYGLFPPNIGGVSIHVKRLADRMEQDGYLNYVYVNNYGLFRSFEYPDYCIDVSHSYKLNFFKKLRWINKYLKKDDADIFSLHGSLFWDFIIIYKLAKTCDKKVVFTVHDQMQLNKKDFILLLYKYIYGIIPKNNIFFIAVNPFIKKQLEKIGVCGDRINVIPAFVQENSTTLLDVDLLQEIDDSIMLLLYAPSLRTIDDFDLYGISQAICAYAILLKKMHDKVKLLICVPNGVNKELFDQLVTLNGLDNLDFFLFERPVSNMTQLLKNIHIYLRPTISDGDSVLIREALAENCLVLASDIVTRPVGTYLYKLHDVDDLHNKLSYMISNLQLLKATQNNSLDFYSDIISVYNKHLHENPSYL